MLYTVEVRRIGADLTASMAEMRTWLGHNGIDATESNHSSGDPGIAFRVRFRQASDALAFAKAFGGWLNHGNDPEGAAFGVSVSHRLEHDHSRPTAVSARGNPNHAYR